MCQHRFWWRAKRVRTLGLVGDLRKTRPLSGELWLRIGSAGDGRVLARYESGAARDTAAAALKPQP